MAPSVGTSSSEDQRRVNQDVREEGKSTCLRRRRFLSRAPTGKGAVCSGPRVLLCPWHACSLGLKFREICCSVRLVSDFSLQNTFSRLHLLRIVCFDLNAHLLYVLYIYMCIQKKYIHICIILYKNIYI